MRAVLDTVIFVRALINPKSRCGRLLFDLSERFVVVLSPDTIRELVTVLYRPTLRRRFPQMADPPHLDRVLELLQRAEVVNPGEPVSVSRNPSDDKFFTCAVAGGAAYIVSEDKDLLDVVEYRGVHTITSAEFIALLERG